jgi:hypothetical protein
MGIEVQSLEVRNPDDFENVFEAVRPKHPDALIAVEDPLVGSGLSRIATFAAANKLPAINGFRDFAEAVGLMAYGASLSDLFRRAAAYVDKILRGANPADLPIQQPTKFELVTNLKTAKALGLIFPPTLRPMLAAAPTVSQLSNVITQAMAPAFLLAALAAFIALLIARLNRIVDRTILVNAISDNDAARSRLKTDIPRLLRRSTIINRAILWAVISSIAITLIMIVAFVSALPHIERGVAVLFHHIARCLHAFTGRFCARSKDRLERIRSLWMTDATFWDSHHYSREMANDAFIPGHCTRITTSHNGRRSPTEL